MIAMKLFAIVCLVIGVVTTSMSLQLDLSAKRRAGQTDQDHGGVAYVGEEMNREDEP